MSRPFDSEAFTKRFEHFVDELLPEDDRFLTMDDIAAVLRRTREFLAEENDVPPDYQRELLESIIRPWLNGRGFQGTERADAKRKWSEAVGFDLPLPN